MNRRYRPTADVQTIISSGVKTRNIDMFITSSEIFSQANYTKVSDNICA